MQTSTRSLTCFVQLGTALYAGFDTGRHGLGSIVQSRQVFVKVSDG